jgi:hypothetical protein
MIEEGEERSEGIGDGVGTTMLHESGKHFEAAAMIEATLVLKEESETAFFDGEAYCPFHA